jgi:hypothetical protein
MSPRQSNSKKTPTKNGVKGASKNDAQELRDAKKLILLERKRKKVRQQNLILLKKRKKKNSSSNLPDELKSGGGLGD